MIAISCLLCLNGTTLKEYIYHSVFTTAFCKIIKDIFKGKASFFLILTLVTVNNRTRITNTNCYMVEKQIASQKCFA